MLSLRPAATPSRRFGVRVAWGLVAPLLVLNAATAEAPARHSPDDIAARIDRLVEESWVKGKVVPAPPADDGEFLRRAFLDLAGKIPGPYETREFLAQSASNKRLELIDQLLGRATFARRLSNSWRAMMLPGANNSFEARALVPSFEDWLKARFLANVSYDALARETLTFEPPSDNADGAPPANLRAPSPMAFYQINERKPENLAAASARVFLGLQVQCAQCHNHPFADWKQEQFWSYAAFFKGVDGKAADPRSIAIPGANKRTVNATFLDGATPSFREGESGRRAVARWMTDPANPYFARATANRLWAFLFGRGLVDPVDDLDPANEPAHPAVLDLVARQLVAHDYDVKAILRALAATRLYALSSRTTHASQDEWRHFARMPVRRMTPEQLFDSVVQATGYREGTPRRRGLAVFDLTSAREKFLAKFADDGASPTDYQASILQALTLMNGPIVSGATSLSDSETLRAVLDAPFLDAPAKIETLFLATTTRKPDPDELAAMQRHIERYEPSEREKGFADVFWALLNSPEFVLVP